MAEGPVRAVTERLQCPLYQKSNGQIARNVVPPTSRSTIGKSFDPTQFPLKGFAASPGGRHDGMVYLVGGQCSADSDFFRSLARFPSD